MVFAIKILLFIIFYFFIFFKSFQFFSFLSISYAHFTEHLVYLHFYLIFFPDNQIFLEKRDSFDWHLLSSERDSHVIF